MALLKKYPRLKVLEGGDVLDVVPVNHGFAVECAGNTLIKITGDILENGIVITEQDKPFLSVKRDTRDIISQTVSVLRKINIILLEIQNCPWCNIEYIWTPWGNRYEIRAEESTNLIFCIKSDPEIPQNFIVIDSKKVKRYEIKRKDNKLQIKAMEQANNDNTTSKKELLRDKLLLVCTSVLISTPETKTRICCNFNHSDTTKSICTCDVNCSLQHKTFFVCIVLFLLILICTVSFSSWVW
ncbi:uncharacterized protein [Mytilus edulis]|uniref:uncharacterized protein n=1 Tax=Mytilus edulis TaxID=6550 RepID=UPI0039EFB833